MADYDSDDEKSQFDKLRYAKVPRGMHVSGWDDDADELIEEDRNPQASIERMILWAVNENKLSEVKEILRLDPEAVTAIDNDGYTPLHRACYNNFEDIAKLLIQYKADPNAKTNMGWTPLHSACKWSNAQCALLLLQHGADVNAQSDGQQTPLHIAATVSNCRNTATVLMMDHNINAQALNNSEETARDIALRTGLTGPVFEMGHSAYDVETVSRPEAIVQLMEPCKAGKPPTDPEVYYCRKGYYSLNVMVICDYQMKVRAVDASRPGSCHDAFVWNLSDANKYFAEMYLNGIRNSWLLADSAYALEPYVLVPYKAPSCGSKYSGKDYRQFEKSFQMSSIVLTLHSLKVVKITNICCALHNICKHFNVPIEDENMIASIPNDEIDENLHKNKTTTNMKGWFDAFRDDGGPTLYSFSNRTPVTGDVSIVAVSVLFATFYVAFLVIFPGVRKQKFTTFSTVTLSLFVGLVILITRLGSAWHVAHTTIIAPYKAFSREKLPARIGTHIGLMHVNVTLTVA
ncbi:Ankyrin repeat domain-containing protein 49 [Lucilia cuprina]|nr:Ankyrin repeat domain-containing protein 49 [Lucilia cuprina]